jgi:hypothetical protein
VCCAWGGRRRADGALTVADREDLTALLGVTVRPMVQTQVLPWSLAFLAGACLLVYLQSTPVLSWMVLTH